MMDNSFTNFIFDTITSLDDPWWNERYIFGTLVFD